MLDKLRREWKTFAWGIVCLALEGYDAGAAALDYDSYIPENYKPLIHFAVPAGFFLLRKWRDTNVSMATEPARDADPH